jgi:hypothetical protein
MMLMMIYSNKTSKNNQKQKLKPSEPCGYLDRKIEFRILKKVFKNNEY